MTISQTNSLLKKLKGKNSAVNVEVNMKIKLLQKRLVNLTFMEGDHSEDYYAVLGKIKELRMEIFNGEAQE